MRRRRRTASRTKRSAFKEENDDTNCKVDGIDAQIGFESAVVDDPWVEIVDMHGLRLDNERPGRAACGIGLRCSGMSDETDRWVCYRH